MKHSRPGLAGLLALILLGAGAGVARLTATAEQADLSGQVEIIRTAHGVPHIRAENLRAAGYALAWLQLEDYGPRTALTALRARGEMGRVFGRDSMESDFHYRRARQRAVASYHRLEQETRDVYAGFAAGINRYIALHPEEFPPGMPADFTGYDIATLDVGLPRPGNLRAALPGLPARTGGGSRPREESEGNVGSNTWAFAPSRTKSGHAILLRNPHLAWTAGYYEAHMTVPGVLDFYGDFRIGGPFAVIGGFNRHLGWSTTNNAQDLDELYALEADSARPDHYKLDGASLPLLRDPVTVEYRLPNGNGNGSSRSAETREFWSTPLGPVVHRSNGKIYILKAAGDGEFRAGEQFLRMMRARTLDEWKDAMKLRARVTSNFTYADGAGNIFYVWNAALPVLPHAPGGDSVVFPARETREIWTRYVPFELLPQVLNPPGGYLHNENSSPHFTNVRLPLDTLNRYPNFEPPSLSLRSQLAIELVNGDEKLALEDVVRLKHSYRMLLAERVKPDLIAAVKAGKPTGEVAAALALLEQWDNTAAPESRGAALFEVWWQQYSQGRPDSLRFAKVWAASDPFRTPSGLADRERAAQAFGAAVAETARRYGSFAVTWGEVHRVRRGTVDVPVGGCTGAMGCFRTLAFTRDADGKLAVSGGDGWVLAVEFSEVPRAYSVLAYGESSRPESPWYADQAELFARGELKQVAFTREAVDAQAVVRYRPGQGTPK